MTARLQASVTCLRDSQPRCYSEPTSLAPRGTRGCAQRTAMPAPRRRGRPDGAWRPDWLPAPPRVHSCSSPDTLPSASASRSVRTGPTCSVIADASSPAADARSLSRSWHACSTGSGSLSSPTARGGRPFGDAADPAGCAAVPLAAAGASLARSYRQKMPPHGARSDRLLLTKQTLQVVPTPGGLKLYN